MEKLAEAVAMTAQEPPQVVPKPDVAHAEAGGLDARHRIGAQAREKVDGRPRRIGGEVGAVKRLPQVAKGRRPEPHRHLRQEDQQVRMMPVEVAREFHLSRERASRSWPPPLLLPDPDLAPRRVATSAPRADASSGRRRIRWMIGASSGSKSGGSCASSQ